MHCVQTMRFNKSTSVLLIVGPKCTLAASHAAPLSHGEYADGKDTETDGRTDGRTDGQTDGQTDGR